jgi:hypothetical protein
MIQNAARPSALFCARAALAFSHRKWACQRTTDDAHQDYGAKK